MVSRLKMGEMEEVEVDHVATNTPSQKVRPHGDEDEVGAALRQVSRSYAGIRGALSMSCTKLKRALMRIYGRRLLYVERPRLEYICKSTDTNAALFQLNSRRRS